MNKTIIFDLNGVFITSPRLSDRFEQEFGVKNEDFLPVLSEIMDKVRRPNAVSIFSLFKQYLDNWNINMTEDEFLNYWFNAEKENKVLVDLARKLKTKGYKLIIMSNNFRERAEFYINKFKFLDELFDKVYYSWQTGFVKPDKKAFELIFTDYNLEPSNCIYFDDSEKNIDLANSLGIESHIYTDESVDYLKNLLD